MAIREKGTDPYGQPYRKPDTALPVQEEIGLVLDHTRRGPNYPFLWMPQRIPLSMSALERKPVVPASTPEEDLGPGSDFRGIPRGPF